MDATDRLRRWPNARRAFVVPLVLLLAAAGSALSVRPARADASASLASAEAQLASLGDRIDAASADVRSLQDRVTALSERLTAAGDDVAKLRSQVTYLSAAVAGEADPSSLGSAQQRALLASLRPRLSAATRRLAAVQQRAETRSILPTLFRAQADLARLESDRTEAISVVNQLQGEERAAAIAALDARSTGPTSIAYGDWAHALLRSIGLPECTNDLVTLVAWQMAESTRAAWNPLATTHDAPDAGSFNGAGVKNYASLEAGLAATSATLFGGYDTYGYGWILYDLSRCSDPMTTATAINASAWCAGCAGGGYVTDLIARVSDAYDIYASL